MAAKKELPRLTVDCSTNASNASYHTNVSTSSVTSFIATPEITFGDHSSNSMPPSNPVLYCGAYSNSSTASASASLPFLSRPRDNSHHSMISNSNSVQSVTMLFSTTSAARTPDLTATPVHPNSFDINDPFAFAVMNLELQNEMKTEQQSIPSMEARNGSVDRESVDLRRVSHKILIGSVSPRSGPSAVSTPMTPTPPTSPRKNTVPNDETKEEDIIEQEDNTGISSKCSIPSPPSPMMDPEVLCLSKHGYERGRKLADTLQGAVYEVTKKKDGILYVVKQTNKILHRQGITVQKGKQYMVKEDVCSERKILEWLTNLKGPGFMTKFVDFAESHDHYYLVQEHGGQGLFEFVIKAHEYIQEKKMAIREWRKFVKYLMWQMSVFLLWLHNTGHVCHLDVSLENLLVHNAKFIEQDDGKVTISTEIEIKFCDFGLAEWYRIDDINAPNAYLSTKYCGKTNYKSPQVFSKEGPFDARKADVYSLGVCFFCLAIGAPPYKTPTSTDKGYADYISKGKIANLLFSWRRHHYVTERMLSLLGILLEPDENRRPTMDDVVHTPWLRSYYQRYYAMIADSIKEEKVAEM